jgi:hypothetical protein
VHGAGRRLRRGVRGGGEAAAPRSYPMRVGHRIHSVYGLTLIFIININLMVQRYTLNIYNGLHIAYFCLQFA